MNSATKILLIISGTVSLAVGIVGAFLPVLPTTPFVLLAAYCYVRSSPRMYTWVMNSRFAGRHVHGVLAGLGIPLSVKIIAVLISVCMIGYVCIFVTDNLGIRLLLAAILIVQIIFMVRIKTLDTTVKDSESKNIGI